MIHEPRVSTIVAVGDVSPIGRAVLGHAFAYFDVKAVLFPTERMWNQFRSARPPQWRRIPAGIRRRIRRQRPFPLEAFEELEFGQRLEWDAVVERWGDSNFGLMLSAGFPAIFPDRVLAIAERQVNVHTSLLPQLKGRHPHYWAVQWGFDRSGLTAHEMTSELDSGDPVGQVVVHLAPGTDYHQHYRDLQLAVPQLLGQVESWVRTGQRVEAVDVEESWSPGEAPEGAI